MDEARERKEKLGNEVEGSRVRVKIPFVGHGVFMHSNPLKALLSINNREITELRITTGAE